MLKLTIYAKEKIGVNKRSLEDINKNVYSNHTYLKIFGAFGFEFVEKYMAKRLGGYASVSNFLQVCAQKNSQKFCLWMPESSACYSSMCHDIDSACCSAPICP